MAEDTAARHALLPRYLELLASTAGTEPVETAEMVQ